MVRLPCTASNARPVRVQPLPPRDFSRRSRAAIAAAVSLCPSSRSFLNSSWNSLSSSSEASSKAAKVFLASRVLRMARPA